MIYFDNAATSGHKPKTVINAVEAALERLSANPGRSGHSLSQRAAMMLYSARKTVADMFGPSGEEKVVFTANCTQSINMVIKGVLSVEDRVIVSDLEHNAVMRPLYKSGVAYDIARVSFEDDDETVKSFESLIKKDTKMIFCTAASNVCGKVLPLEKLGRLCRENNLLFAVDAAQAAGVIPINMEKMNIDYLCIAPHKGLYAPMGIGILIAQKPIGRTIIEGGTGNNSLSLIQPEEMPERLESGTVNLPAAMGVKAGAEFVLSKGIDKIYRYEMMLTEYIFSELSRMEKIVLYTPRPTLGLYAPVLSFNIKGLNSEKVALLLDKAGVAVRAGLHCAPAAHRRLGTVENGTVRVCPSVFSTKKEADFLLNALKKIKL